MCSKPLTRPCQVATDVSRCYGDYHPVSYRVTTYGYSKEDVIRYNDTWESPGFGLLYRVPIRGHGREDAQQQVQEETIGASTEPRRIRVKAKAKSTPRLGKAPEEWNSGQKKTWATKQKGAVEELLKLLGEGLLPFENEEKQTLIPPFIQETCQKAKTNAEAVKLGLQNMLDDDFVKESPTTASVAAVVKVKKEVLQGRNMLKRMIGVVDKMTSLQGVE